MLPAKNVIGSCHTQQLAFCIPSMQLFGVIHRHGRIMFPVHDQLGNLQSSGGTFDIQSRPMLHEILVELNEVRHVLVRSAILHVHDTGCFPILQFRSWLKR